MTKVRGPKDGEIVTASFDGKAKLEFPSLSDTSCIILNSIKGNEFCRGPHLAATIAQSIAKHKKTTLVIADEIYWHNLKTPETSQEVEGVLKKEACALGSAYIDEQLPFFLEPLGKDSNAFTSEHGNKTASEKIAFINLLGNEKNFEILRWRDWIDRAPARFNDQKSELLNLYATDETLKESVQVQATDFAKRHATKEEPFELQLARSKDYLTEESLDIIWLAAYLNYNFIVYPGPCPKPFQATKDYFVKESNPDMPEINSLILTERPRLLANWLEVNYTRAYEKNPKETPKALDASQMDSIKTYIANGQGFFSPPPKAPNDLPPKDHLLTIFISEVAKAVLAGSMSNSEKVDMLVNVYVSISNVNNENEIISSHRN